MRPDVYGLQKPKMAAVRKHQVVDFDGYCYDYEANAKLITEVRTAKQACAIENKKLVDEEAAKCRAEQQKKQAEFDAKEAKYKLLIKEQSKALKNKKYDGYLYAGIGIIAGAIVSGVTVYLVKK